MELLKIKKSSKLMALFVLISLSLSSCYKDNEETLYPPDGADCVTENVSFSETLWPVINNNCVSCHSGAAASAGIRMGTHAELVATVNDGRFLGAVRHDPGFSAMPKGAPKLTDCQISQIEAWVAQGMLNN